MWHYHWFYFGYWVNREIVFLLWQQAFLCTQCHKSKNTLLKNTKELPIFSLWYITHLFLELTPSTKYMGSQSFCHLKSCKAYWQLLENRIIGETRPPQAAADYPVCQITSTTTNWLNALVKLKLSLHNIWHRVHVWWFISTCIIFTDWIKEKKITDKLRT